jgi:phage terminase large subunit
VAVVTIPYKPRPFQVSVHESIERSRFSVLVCHRRFGKTVLAVNHLIKQALLNTTERPRYGYLAPTYTQAKSIAWDYLKHYAGVIPGASFNETELRCDLPNGARIRLFGADNPDSLRGLYFDGVVLDEYGVMRGNVFTEVVRPALADRKGWAVFIGTPNGKNQFWDIAAHAQASEDWEYACYRASETGVLDQSELSEARTLMTEDEYRQEFECSFEASVRGAIYAKELSDAKDGGRITRIPHDPALKVDTFWDLGVGDATTIWFAQSVGQEVRLIDYYEASGEGLPHYAQVIASRGYTYGRHVAPHDIQVRELATGRSRLEVAESLGIRFEVAPQVSVEDGIHAVRMILPRCWFDETKCRAGIEALQNYRRDFNSRLNEFKATPVHDWASHGADAFRYFAVSHKARTDTKRPIPQRYNVGWMG